MAESGALTEEKEGKSKPPRWRVPVFICAFFAGLAALTTSISTIIDNGKTLPVKIAKATGDIQSWYHDDQSWSGHWTNKPEGYVDSADMNLSAEDMSIELSVVKGEIDGIIATKSICNSTPYNFLLLKGSVSGESSADVVVWDVIGGRATDFAKLRLKRDGPKMSVTPIDGMVGLVPKEGRLALDPTDEPIDSFKRKAFCSDRTKRLVEPRGTGASQ